MYHYLIIYNKQEQELVFLHRYTGENVELALADRFVAERALKEEGTFEAHEVVVIGANSIEHLMRNHGRYFGLPLIALAAQYLSRRL